MKTVDEIVMDLIVSARKYTYQCIFEGLALDTYSTDYLSDMSLEDLKEISYQLHLALESARTDKDVIRRAGLIVSKEVIDTEISLTEEDL